MNPTDIGNALGHTFGNADWLALFTHFLSLSLLSIGGAITTAPSMHHYLVVQRGWISDGEFTASIALAQAAPGPNLLFVALLGGHVGFHAGGGAAGGTQAWTFALAGVLVSMLGILLPSTTLTFMAARWGHRNRELRAVRAFKQGMAPIVIGLLAATAWVLATSQTTSPSPLGIALLSGATALIVWRTRLHMLWLLGAGALAGWLGWV